MLLAMFELWGIRAFGASKQSSTNYFRDRREPIPGASLTAIQAVRVPKIVAETLLYRVVWHSQLRL